MNILEEFWYGNIEPAEYDISSSNGIVKDGSARQSATAKTEGQATRGIKMIKLREAHFKRKLYFISQMQLNKRCC